MEASSRSLAHGGLLLALIGLVGCSGGKASVTGTVTYKGKALTSGTVSMVGPDGIVKQGLINADGTYTVEDVAAGTVQIGVVSNRPSGDARGAPRRPGAKSRQAPPPPAADGPGDVAGWFPIPTTYQDPAASGLTTAIKSGSNKHDIELK